MIKLHYTYRQEKIIIKKSMIFFTKIIQYFELHIYEKRQILQHVIKFVISQSFTLKKKSLLFVEVFML